MIGLLVFNSYCIFMHSYMKERHIRLEAIRRLIQREKIKSQDTLLKYMQEEGFLVTQATLSRDLKKLRVGKTSDEQGSNFYTLHEDEAYQGAERTYIQDFMRGFISIDWSGNIVIVKTHSGHSDPVAVALDSLNLDGILGTIAGNDNTVAIFLKEGISGQDFMKIISEKIPEIG